MDFDWLLKEIDTLLYIRLREKDSTNKKLFKCTQQRTYRNSVKTN